MTYAGYSLRLLSFFLSTYFSLLIFLFFFSSISAAAAAAAAAATDKFRCQTTIKSLLPLYYSHHWNFRACSQVGSFSVPFIENLVDLFP